MSRQQTQALQRRFGLSGAPPVVFTATPTHTAWGMSAVDAQAQVPAEQATAELIDWLAKSYPGLIEAVLEAVGAETIIESEGLGQTQEKGLLRNLLDTVQTVLPAYLQFEQQREVLDIQLERARAGLPPLNTGQFAPSVQVGLDRDTIARIADEAGSRAASGAGAFFSSPWLWLGLTAVGVGYMAMRKPRRRRR